MIFEVELKTVIIQLVWRLIKEALNSSPRRSSEQVGLMTTFHFNRSLIDFIYVLHSKPPHSKIGLIPFVLVWTNKHVVVPSLTNLE